MTKIRSLNYAGCALLLFLSIALVSCQGAAAPEEEVLTGPLIISSWGGSWAEKFEEHVVKPFEAEFNVDVILDTGPSGERLAKLLATEGEPEFDITLLADHQAALAKEKGLLVSLQEENVPNLQQLYEDYRDPLGGGTCPTYTVVALGLAYNKEMVSPPFSWKDLWNVDLRDNIAIPTITNTTGPLLFLELNALYGGSTSNFAPVFDVIESGKDNIHIIYSRTQEVITAVNQGDVALGAALNIFVSESPDSPIAFAWPTEGGLGLYDVVCVVKGTKRQALAEKFINFYLDAERQRLMAINQSESPTNKLVEIPEGTGTNVIYGQEMNDSLIFFDPNLIAANLASWTETWNERIIAE
jgi:putative spermidine/putrescine transport system substrate-binding protein